MEIGFLRRETKRRDGSGMSTSTAGHTVIANMRTSGNLLSRPVDWYFPQERTVGTLIAEGRSTETPDSAQLVLSSCSKCRFKQRV